MADPTRLRPVADDVLAGNFHTALVFKDDSEMDHIHAAVDRMVKRAIALDGTCTGEHGVGIGKRDYLYEELGEGTVELMKSVKKAIDPLNLFNPGKVCVRAVGIVHRGADAAQLYPDHPTRKSGKDSH